MNLRAQSSTTGKVPIASEIPAAAYVLGWFGAIPFIFLSLAKIVVSAEAEPVLVNSLVTYAAVILSFMGGVQWGLAMVANPGNTALSQATHFSISVIPALVAWIALFVDPMLSFAVLGFAFAALLVFDLWSSRWCSTPPWYLRLRKQLTAAVVASLFVASIAG